MVGEINPVSLLVDLIEEEKKCYFLFIFHTHRARARKVMGKSIDPFDRANDFVAILSTDILIVERTNEKRTIA